MKYVKHVKTNAKVGANVELGPKTLIVGPNGSGKSTILNAIELALTSRVSDIAGREDVAREADVMQLAPLGQSLLAEVVFDSGEGASYLVEGSTAKAKKAAAVRPNSIDPDTVLPIRVLKEAVLGSPQTARKYLLGKVAGSVSREHITSLIALPVRDLWLKLLASQPSTLSAPDALVAVLENAGKQQREANGQAKTAREAGKLVSGGRASPPSESELSEARSTVEQLRGGYQTALAGQTAFAQLTGTQERLAAAMKVAQTAIEQHAFRQSELANLPEVEPPHPVLPHVCEVLRASLAAGECLVCGTGKPDAAALPLVEQAIAASRQSAEARKSLERLVQGTKESAERTIASVEALEAEVARLSQVDTDPLGHDPAALKPQLDAAEAQLLDLRALADSWTRIQGAEAQALEAEAAAERWGTLKSSCEAAVGIVLDAALENFIARVQANLPPTDVFDLKLRDGEREVVQFGLLRDERLITALSGAEWARVVAAMASACCSDSQFGVLIPEERAFDPATLNAVLRAFSACEQQVILASPVAPSGRLPKGWTVVETAVRASAPLTEAAPF